MRAFVLGLCFLALASAQTIKYEDGYMNLLPDVSNGVTETRFNLNAASGCKLLLTCMFKTYSCRQATIKIFDGEAYTQHCPEASQYVFKNSNGNQMSVTIENAGPSVGAFCQVKATKPYLNVPEPVIDSSEHGLAHKSKKSTTCRCGWTNKSPRRIVGGKVAGVNEYPFPILLMFTESKFPFCGGSIVTERHVMTAAHCTDPYLDRKLSVAVGEHDVRTQRETSVTKIISVKRIHQHSGYSDSSNKHDISILELAEPIKFTDKIGPVCLPTAQKNMMGEFIKVMGWGLTRDKSEGGRASPELRKVNLRVIDPDVCKSVYRIDTDVLTQVCTYNNMKDSCQGDSGGPLVRLNPATNMYEQVALVSYGRKCGSTDPAVNTDVAYYIDWIRQQVAKSPDKVELCF